MCNENFNHVLIQIFMHLSSRTNGQGQSYRAGGIVCHQSHQVLRAVLRDPANSGPRVSGRPAQAHSSAAAPQALPAPLLPIPEIALNKVHKDQPSNQPKVRSIQFLISEADPVA